MNILIITDSLLFSVAFSSVIHRGHPLARIVEVDSLRKAVALTTGEHFEIAILDIAAEDGKDIGLIQTFMQLNDNTSLWVNLGDSFEYLYTLIRIGVNVLFSRRSAADEIQNAFLASSLKHKFVSSEIQNILVKNVLGSQRTWELTGKEKLVAEMIIMSRSNIQIAAAMGIKPNTVSLYKKRIFQKMDVRNVIELKDKLTLS